MGVCSRQTSRQDWQSHLQRLIEPRRDYPVDQEGISRGPRIRYEPSLSCCHQDNRRQLQRPHQHRETPSGKGLQNAPCRSLLITRLENHVIGQDMHAEEGGKNSRKHGNQTNMEGYKHHQPIRSKTVLDCRSHVLEPLIAIPYPPAST